MLNSPSAGSSQWQEANNSRKKRPRSSPGTQPGKRTPTQRNYTKLDYWLNNNKENVTSNSDSNKFSLLSQAGNPETTDQPTEPQKPPPLFVASVKDINPLTSVLNNVAKDNFILRIVNFEEVKIQAKTAQAFDAIVDELKKKNTEYHSYQKKQDRPFRVVLKNIHSSSDIEALKEELTTLGHQVINITNIQHRITKTKLSMFYINLKVAPNNKDVYNIEFLLNTKIKFEAPNKKREIPQCTRCQRYEHTKNFCSRQARCVKCAGNHLTQECPMKERSNNVKCVHCEGNHPANYKGCSIYKQLQKSKFPALRKKVNSPFEPAPVSQQREPVNQQFRREGISYAEQLRQQSNEELNNNNSSDFSELKNMITGLVQQMSTMLNLLTTLVKKVINV